MTKIRLEANASEGFYQIMVLQIVSIFEVIIIATVTVANSWNSNFFSFIYCFENDFEPNDDSCASVMWHVYESKFMCRLKIYLFDQTHKKQY